VSRRREDLVLSAHPRKVSSYSPPEKRWTLKAKTFASGYECFRQSIDEGYTLRIVVQVQRISVSIVDIVHASYVFHFTFNLVVRVPHSPNPWI
jgi:hypothetical protein